MSILAQVPLTVSPFVSLPTATTLPYTYKPLPASLPPSSIGQETEEGQGKQKYIVSASGRSAHPDGIIASCRALKTHLEQLQADGKKKVEEWEAAINERELAEKRRVAPGWLDSDARILEPARASVKPDETAHATTSADLLADTSTPKQDESENALGAELDLAFGQMGLSRKRTSAKSAFKTLSFEVSSTQRSIPDCVELSKAHQLDKAMCSAAYTYICRTKARSETIKQSYSFANHFDFKCRKALEDATSKLKRVPLIDNLADLSRDTARLS